MSVHRDHPILKGLREAGRGDWSHQCGECTGRDPGYHNVNPPCKQTLIVNFIQDAIQDAFLRGVESQAARFLFIDKMLGDCAFFTHGTCSGDPSRSPRSEYSSTGYCYPCMIRWAMTVDLEEVAVT